MANIPVSTAIDNLLKSTPSTTVTTAAALTALGAATTGNASIVAADLAPGAAVGNIVDDTLPVAKVTGTLPVAKGGTGAATASTARTNILPSFTGNGGKVLAVNAGATDVEYITANATGVIVTKTNGTRTNYPPSADTDTARGLALEAAFAAAAAGDTIDLSPGNYLVAKATSTVIAVATHYAILANMTVRLNGARLYHQTAFNGAVMFGADAVDDWSILGPGIIEGTVATPTGSPSGEIGINTRTGRRWTIQGITVRYFKNIGIQANSSNYSGYSTPANPSGLKISTGHIHGCNLDFNNIGFGNYSSSEYISFTNTSLNKNLTAADMTAGNTKFAGCEASGNTNYALRIRAGGNSGHGCFVGGHITHNEGFAVFAEAGMTSGFIFSGVTFGADSTTSNKIECQGGGMNFTGCYMESPFFASATPTGNNFMSDCFISGTYTVHTDLSTAERLRWKFVNNHTLGGAWSSNDALTNIFADNTAALGTVIPITSVVSSVISSVMTATVTTTTAHGLTTGAGIIISGATGTGVLPNGQFSVTVTGASTLTFPLATTAQTFTGTITSTYGLTPGEQYRTSAGDLRIVV